MSSTLSSQKSVQTDPNERLDLAIFRLAVANVNEHIIITDPRGLIVYVNAAAEKITGYSESEMLGKKPGELWGGRMSPEFYRQMWQRIKVEKQTFRGEINNVKKNGQAYVASSLISPVLDEKGEVEFYVGIERDITEEKAIDRAKTEFVSLASHQLRTPLTAINWYSEYLLSPQSGGNLNPEQLQYLQEIQSSARQMTELVNTLLNVSRIDLGTLDISPNLENIVTMATGVLRELQPEIDRKNLTVTEKYDRKLPQLMLDASLIRTVFQNLLSNAVKYTPEGGRIFVTIEVIKGQIQVTIRDTGYGIPKEQQEKIFRKLFRADNVQKMAIEGNGLGLYIVKSIIEASGGQISFNSKENEGTTFTFTLPLTGMPKLNGNKLLSTMASLS